MFQRQFRTLGLLSAAVVAGCGPGVETGEVRGVVMLGDEPLDSIMVYFMPEPAGDDERAVAWGVTDAEGRFRLEYQGAEGTFGAVPGRYRVTLEDLVPQNFRGETAPPTPRIPASMMNPASTPWRYDVTVGEQTIDIDIATPPPASSKMDEPTGSR